MTEPSAKLEVILQTITAGVVAVDPSGRVSYANQAALRELERTGEEVIGRSWNSLVPALSGTNAHSGSVAVDPEHRYQAVLQATAESTPRSVGFLVIRARPTNDEVDLVVLMRGLTEVAVLEEHGRRRERLAGLGRLVGGLAHELRNPLAAVQALADSLLIEIGPGDPRVEYATRIIDAVGRMEAFVRAAVRFAQPTNSEPVRCEAAELLTEALRLANLGASEPGTQWLCGGPLYCRVDRRQVAECLAALLTNADEASGRPEGTRIRVSRHVDSADVGWLRFDVSDDGPGIPGELHFRVFEPFYSTKPARTGMGLAFAQTTALQNGGRIELRSAPAAGSTFTLWLPEEAP